MEDAKIIDLLWNRNQQALKEITIKYEKLCIEVAKNILGNIRDAEEIVNEVYLAVWNSIPPEKPEYLKAYICKIVKNLATIRIRHNKALKRNAENTVSINELETILTSGNITEQIVDKNLLSDYISDYLRTINKKQRNLFIGRYWYNYSIKELSIKCNISENNVKTSLHRTRSGLKKYLEKKGVEL